MSAPVMREGPSFGRRGFFSLAPRFAAISVAAIAFAASSASSGAQEAQADRVKRLGAKLFCACGCNQILTACNHVGCTVSTKMLAELNDRIARGDSDELVLQSFVQEYGPTVLAQPPAKGFNALVWVMPVVLPIAAVLLVWGIVKKWRGRAELAPAGGPAVDAALLARAHREAEDRED